MNPKITFIVSAYNRPSSLKLCLLSLILQTEESWTAVVTDNYRGETYNDLNRGVIEEFGDPRIGYLYTGDVAPECYAAAEVAVEMADGDWLGFPSDDSYYVPHYASKLLLVAEAMNLELVYSDLVLSDPVNGGVLRCEAKCCHIDKTNFLVKRSRFIPFPGKDPNPGGRSCSDGLLIDELVRQGIRHCRVAQPLCVHV